MNFVFWTNFAKRCVVGIVLVNLGACAAVVSGNDTTTTVSSDPSSADCSISGNGFQTTFTTPKAFSIPTNAAPLTVSCEKTDFFQTENTITAEGNPWVLGNAIIGGGIGLLVDVASGSSVKLPKNVLIKLDPKKFQSLTELTAYFENRKATESAAWDKLIKLEKARNCQNKSYSVDCPHEPNPELLKKKEEVLERMDWMAANAVVVPVSQ